MLVNIYIAPGASAILSELKDSLILHLQLRSLTNFNSEFPIAYSWSEMQTCSHIYFGPYSNFKHLN